MCSRYSATLPVEAMRSLFNFDNTPNLAARFNIAPTQDVPVVRRRADGSRALNQIRWGLIPSWAKDARIGVTLINARAESLAEKPSFRAAFARRRCLIPADGYYEWQKLNAKEKQTWRFERPDGGAFAFAGLWERWQPQAGTAPSHTAPDHTAIDSCTIVTTEANALIRPIADRMPVILPQGDFAAWLDSATPQPALAGLLVPCSDDFLTARPIGSYVNNVRHEGPACLAH